MREIMEEAARQGYPQVEGLWQMTMWEVEQALTAFAANRQAEAERDDRLAWMTGYYCAVACHAPRRYPPRPHLIRQARKAMTEAQMKRVLMAVAAGRRNKDDVGNAKD